MRHVLFAAMLFVTVGLNLARAQESDSAPSSAQPTPKSAQPENLPAHPVPVPMPPSSSPAPNLFAPSAPPPYLPAPTETPVLFTDNSVDGFPRRFWISADYLLWWTKGDQLPPLVTTGPRTDRIPGAIGQPGTQVLFGGDYNTDVRSGARFRGGYWLTPDQILGVDGTFFFLGGEGTRFGASSVGTPILARPFFDVNNNREDADLIAYPGRQGGGLAATISNHLWGADTNLRSLLFRGPSYQLSLLGGFRFLDLHDQLRMRETDILYPQRGGFVTDWVTTVDHFRTSNQFYGGQLGADLLWVRGRFSVNLLTKVALGGSIQRSTINGWSGFEGSDGSSGRIGVGQLALPTNIGWSEKDQFAVVPEVGVNLGYSITRHLRLVLGYTFLYWSHVFRSGDQIDRAINTTEFPAVLGQGSFSGPQRPTFTFKDSDFWAQGLNFGLEYRY